MHACRWQGEDAGLHEGGLVTLQVGCIHEHVAEGLCCIRHLNMIREYAAHPQGLATCQSCGTHLLMYRVKETGETIRFGC